MDDYLESGSLTWRQADTLRRLLPEGTPIDRLSRYDAARLIKLHDPLAAWRREPPTPRQEEFLRCYGLWQEGLTKGTASGLIAKAIDKNKNSPGYLECLKEVAMLEKCAARFGYTQTTTTDVADVKPTTSLGDNTNVTLPGH